MDERIKTHARILADHCLDIGLGDEVVIRFESLEAEELVAALNEAIGERGAIPINLCAAKRVRRSFLQGMSPGDYEDASPESFVDLIDSVDAVAMIQGSENTREMSDVPSENHATYRQLVQPVQKAGLEGNWVGTQYPASGDAQNAEMSTEAYEDFVWNAINKDWDAQHAFQQQMADLLDEGSEVRIVSGDATDLTMSIDGMTAVNDDGRDNLPGGEVFTAPVVDSVEGEVVFDKPVLAQGHEIEGARLVFEDGEVVEYAASKNEDVLAALLDTDAGARRVGELGIGMNRDIDRFTHNIGFDEKMGDTVHLALGFAYAESVGEGRDQNQSALHQDMIVDMSDESRIEIDGEVVQMDGTFVFEDEF